MVTRTLPGAPTRTALNALVTTDIVCVSLDASRAMPPPGDVATHDPNVKLFQRGRNKPLLHLHRVFCHGRYAAPIGSGGLGS